MAPWLQGRGAGTPLLCALVTRCVSRFSSFRLPGTLKAVQTGIGVHGAQLLTPWAWPQQGLGWDRAPVLQGWWILQCPALRNATASLNRSRNWLSQSLLVPGTR